MLAILNSLNAHNLPIFQPILMIPVSKFIVHRALSDETYLSLGLLSPLIIYLFGIIFYDKHICSSPIGSFYTFCINLLFVCLFDLIFYVTVNIFSGMSWVEPVLSKDKCVRLAQ